jgi:predicted transport protein
VRLIRSGGHLSEEEYDGTMARLKNFASVEIHRTARKITVFVKGDPKLVELKAGFTRDVSDIGHYGTGGLEIVIDSAEDLEAARPLLVKSYEVS